MNAYFVSVCWQNDRARTGREQPRTSKLKDRRRTLVVESNCAKGAIEFLVDEILSQPNKPDWLRRITFTAAMQL